MQGGNVCRFEVDLCTWKKGCPDSAILSLSRDRQNISFLCVLLASRKSRAAGSLTQSRRPGRVASPDPEDDDEVPDNDDEGADASFTGEDGAINGNKKGLAKEVFLLKNGLTR